MISGADLQGHWRRNWLRTPEVEDRTTRVNWVQVGAYCVDIRVPLVRPGLRGAASLSQLSGPDLAVLLSAEGFAGHVTLERDVCTLHRAWNWRGFPCAVDAGRLWFDDAGRLIEDGVHADYREEWEREPSAPWTALAVRAESGEGLLLSDGSRFLLGIGKRGAAANPALIAALRAGSALPADAAKVFDSVYVLGRWDGGEGIAELSTQPFCEGTAVLQLGAADARLKLPDFFGSLVAMTLHLSDPDFG